MAPRFKTEELVNLYVQGLRTIVREVVAHQVSRLPDEGRGSLPVERQISFAICRSQRVFLQDRTKMGKSPSESKTNTLTKAVMLVPPQVAA